MDIYSEIILDHFKNPKNKGRLPKATKTAESFNPLCGDKLKIHLKFEKGKITKAKFEGTGCAISQASADMLCENLIGKTAKQIKKLTTSQIYKMLGVEISPGRAKCALLALETTKKAVT